MLLFGSTIFSRLKSVLSNSSGVGSSLRTMSLNLVPAGTLIDEKEIPDPEAQSAEAFFSGATGDFPTIAQLEERYVRVVLDKTGGRKDKAAQILGINRRTLYRKEREYGMVAADAPEEEIDFPDKSGEN